MAGKTTPDPRIGAQGFVAPVEYDAATTIKATKPGVKFLRSYECFLCNLTFKEDEFREFQGKRYGIPCGCYKDIAQLASRGQ